MLQVGRNFQNCRTHAAGWGLVYQNAFLGQCHFKWIHVKWDSISL